MWSIYKKKKETKTMMKRKSVKLCARMYMFDRQKEIPNVQYIL